MDTYDSQVWVTQVVLTQNGQIITCKYMCHMGIYLYYPGPRTSQNPSCCSIVTHSKQHIRGIDITHTRVWQHMRDHQRTRGHNTRRATNARGGHQRTRGRQHTRGHQRARGHQHMVGNRCAGDSDMQGSSKWQQHSDARPATWCRNLDEGRDRERGHIVLRSVGECEDDKVLSVRVRASRVSDVTSMWCRVPNDA